MRKGRGLGRGVERACCRGSTHWVSRDTIVAFGIALVPGEESGSPRETGRLSGFGDRGFPE